MARVKEVKLSRVARKGWLQKARLAGQCGQKKIVVGARMRRVVNSGKNMTKPQSLQGVPRIKDEVVLGIGSGVEGATLGGTSSQGVWRVQQ